MRERTFRAVATKEPIGLNLLGRDRVLSVVYDRLNRSARVFRMEEKW